MILLPVVCGRSAASVSVSHTAAVLQGPRYGAGWVLMELSVNRLYLWTQQTFVLDEKQTKWQKSDLWMKK